jgi:LysM repeat protein
LRENPGAKKHELKKTSRTDAESAPPRDMNTPNPLVPQGTFPDKAKSHIRIAVFTILAIHVVLLGALLIAGCKKTAETASLEPTNNVFTPIEPTPPPPTNPPTPVVTNPPTYVPPVAPPPIDLIAPPPPSGTEHIIVKGETFASLAKKYNVSVKAVMAENPGVDPSRLKIGQRVKIPASRVAQGEGAIPPTRDSRNGGQPKTYTVRSGDNLMKIAKAQGVSIKALRSANALKTDQIKVGQKLKIPVKSAPASVPVPATPPGVEPTPPPAGVVPPGNP